MQLFFIHATAAKQAALITQILPLRSIGQKGLVGMINCNKKV